MEEEIVQFFEGLLIGPDGARKKIVWAESSFGNLAKVDAGIRSLETKEIDQMDEKKLLTMVDLAGLDSDDGTYVIRAILKGKYYSMREVSGKLDAALFALVNEAISELLSPIEE